MDDSRKRKVVIDVSDIKTPKQLQVTLKKSLDFPYFYGKNWDAFWDAITGLVMLPEILVFEDWKSLEKFLPGEASNLRELLDLYNKENPQDNWQVEVKFL